MPRILISLGVLTLSLGLIIKGLWAIKGKSIIISWLYAPREKRTGTSAVYWGLTYVALGFIFLIGYVLVQTDYFWTQKLDFSRLF